MSDIDYIYISLEYYHPEATKVQLQSSAKRIAQNLPLAKMHIEHGRAVWYRKH